MREECKAEGSNGPSRCERRCMVLRITIALASFYCLSAGDMKPSDRLGWKERGTACKKKAAGKINGTSLHNSALISP